MAQSGNDGKSLEKLVAMIEGMQLPPGFVVETNKRLYDAHGQIAELDVLITGQVGTVEHKTLFECRDRPSDGSADVGWIEQLDGRRKRLGLSVVVAVSTTGFSGPAIAYAKQTSIPLRVVTEITEEDINGFVSIPKVAPMLMQHVESQHITVQMIPEGVKIPEDGSLRFREGDLQPMSPTEENVIDLASNSTMSLNKLANIILPKHPDTFKDLPVTGERQQRKIEVSREMLVGYRVMANGQRQEIYKMIVDATVHAYNLPYPLVTAVTYSGDGIGDRVIAKWAGGPSGIVTEMTMILHRRPNEKSDSE